MPPQAATQTIKKYGGADRDRTDDLLNAIQALSQLSYNPTRWQVPMLVGSCCKGPLRPARLFF